MSGRDFGGAFRDKVVFVTGSGAGLGAGMARAIGAAGARMVAVSCRHEAQAREVAQAIETAGGRARAMYLDVTDPDAFESRFAEVWDDEGGVDVLINNAGIAVAADARDMSLAFWRQVVEVNLMGVIHGVQAAWPRMAQRGSGHVVNLASAFGLLPGPLYSGYTATKHSVVGLSRSLLAEGRALGIDVTAVCPGFIRTRILDDALVAGLDRSSAEEVIPFRFLELEDAVTRILSGVARRRARVVFPWEIRLLWWLDRLSPALVDAISAATARRYRKLARK
jgi:NAD(P)-dependent dehydrogenase (short-subunit alcohol dehydrogenase family)